MYGTWYGSATAVRQGETITYSLRLVIGPNFVLFWSLDAPYPIHLQMISDPNLVFDQYDDAHNFRGRWSGTRTDRVIDGTVTGWDGVTGTWTITGMPPDAEPQVVNSQNAFGLRYGWLDNHTETLQYSWENTGTQARLHQYPTALMQGTATLVVFDGSGAEVYRASLATAGGDVNTGAGTPGSWIVRLDISAFTGTIDFEMTNTNGDVTGIATGSGHTHTGVITRAQLDAGTAVTVTFTGSGHEHHLPLTDIEVQMIAQGQRVQKSGVITNDVQQHPHDYTFN